MGALVGLLLGLGIFVLVVPAAARRPRPRPARRLQRLLADAGVDRIGPAQLVAGSAAGAMVSFVVVLAVSRAVPVALAFGVFAALTPRSVLRRRGKVRVRARREAWPEAVDHLVSGVRAGLSLPEALSALGTAGPGELRPAFARFADAHRASGSFDRCLEQLAADLADPVGDRVVEALRLAREVGGTDLGGLLRNLSRFLREDARTRGELEARQSWTVNAARVALAAPWLVLLLLATQSSTITAYNSAAGAVVLAIGGAVSYAAYVLMRRIGELPIERRVLR
ncbi:MAG TPA: type II secretion system F family protein [Mycobacteriales bacterium]